MSNELKNLQRRMCERLGYKRYYTLWRDIWATRNPERARTLNPRKIYLTEYDTGIYRLTNKKRAELSFLGAEFDVALEWFIQSSEAYTTAPPWLQIPNEGFLPDGKPLACYLWTKEGDKEITKREEARRKREARRNRRASNYNPK